MKFQENVYLCISMVMPQNEFNSNQPYPACVWKVGSLARFIGKYLGPEMEKHGVEVYYGTIEHAKKELSDSIINDPDAKKYIKGLGFQWAGKNAYAFVNPDGSVVVVAGNQTSAPYKLQLKIDGGKKSDSEKQTITLQPNSLSTIFIRK